MRPHDPHHADQAAGLGDAWLGDAWLGDAWLAAETPASGWDGGFGRPDVSGPPEALLARAVRAPDAWTCSALIEALLADARVAQQVTLAALEAELDRAWQRGWTPQDVVHLARVKLNRTALAVLSIAAVHDAARRSQQGQWLARRWSAQIDVLQTQLSAPRRSPSDVLHAAVALLRWLPRLPALPETLPRPGDQAAGMRAESRIDGGVLGRVQALLAKAESTPYEPEAEAFTAKAQEMITRHAIDEALLNGQARPSTPGVRRVPLHEPYVAAKSSLYAAVGVANRCRVVYDPDSRWVTIVGNDADLDAVEVLAASLLAQATAAMARHGTVVDADGRSRTRSFRHAFLHGFAGRIGQRLRKASDAEVAATPDAQGRLVPVLAAQDQRVREHTERIFPRLRTQQVHVSSHQGYAAGVVAGEHAELGLTSGRLSGGQHEP